MKPYITNLILPHGMGSRVLKIINLIGYSYYLKSKGENVEFINTPLQYEGFDKDFGANELHFFSPYPITNDRDDYIKVCKLWDAMLGIKGIKSTDVPTSDIEFMVHPGKNDQEVFNGIRTNKDQIKSRLSLPSFNKKEYIDVAVHIRRGDVTPDIHPDRWISDEYYLEVINNIVNLLGNKCKITIYSQRANFNNSLYSKYDISYDDQTLDHEIWLKLVQSDILVMGKSAFSYSVGMIHDGIVIYKDMFHPKVFDWIYKEEIEKTLKEKYNI